METLYPTPDGIAVVNGTSPAAVAVVPLDAAAPADEPAPAAPRKPRRTPAVIAAKAIVSWGRVLNARRIRSRFHVD